MNPTEIKIDLFKKLEALKGNQLKEAYGILLNFINSKDDSEEWEKLNKEQKKAIEYGINELDSGKGISHNMVMENMKKKYSND